MTPHHFETRLVWTGPGSIRDYDTYARDYRIEVPGKPPMLGSAAPSFKGDAARHNPEDWLVAALSACHFLTYAALCAKKRIEVLAYEDAATGTMSHDPELRTWRFTEVLLRPHVVIADPSQRDAALALHDRAHGACFIARSVNFPVRNEPTVTTR